MKEDEFALGKVIDIFKLMGNLILGKNIIVDINETLRLWPVLKNPKLLYLSHKNPSLM